MSESLFNVFNRWLVCCSIAAGLVLSTYAGQSVYNRAKKNFDPKTSLSQAESQIEILAKANAEEIHLIGPNLSEYNRKAANLKLIERLSPETRKNVKDSYLVGLMNGAGSASGKMYAVREYGLVVAIAIAAISVPLTCAVSWLALTVVTIAIRKIAGLAS